MPFVHVWFATKSRRRILEGDLLGMVQEELLNAATRHHIEIVELEAVVDDVHILLRLDEAASLPGAMNLLKGSSARALLLLNRDLKHDLKTASFWQRGYGAKLISDEAVPSIREYIRTQWDRLEKYEH